MKPEIDGRQVRAARGLLDWSQSELAEKAELSVLTIKRMEKDAGAASAASLAAVAGALERAGVEFLAPGAAAARLGIGVALRRR